LSQTEARGPGPEDSRDDTNRTALGATFRNGNEPHLRSDRRFDDSGDGSEGDR
jgi:hypothetical protein